MTAASVHAASVGLTLARSAGFVALLTPVAIIAGAVAGTRDRALGLVAGVAAALCTVVLCGLVLSAFKEAHRTGWLIALGVVDLVLIVAAARLIPRGIERIPTMLRGLLARFRVLPAALAAVALAVAVSSVLMSVASARRQQRQSHFTQLWMLPDGSAARLGVKNVEGRTTMYRLFVSAGARTPFSSPSLVLASGQTWSTTVALPHSSLRQLVSASLYEGSGASPYRVTNVWTPGG